MPTQKQRVTVVMPDHMYAVLTGVREVTGQSLSSLVVEFLEFALPTLESMTQAVRGLKAVQAAEFQKVRAALDEAEQDLRPMAERAFQLVQAVQVEVEEAARRAAPAEPGRPSGGPSGVGSPPLLTGGARGRRRRSAVGG